MNSGLITVDEKGTYLATYTLRVPEGEAVDSNFTLNVNDASQTSALVEAGMSVSAIASCGVSTPHATDRFYSYRASRGACGRHGAVAYIPRDTSESGGAA